jgi:hypothetical protein
MVAKAVAPAPRFQSPARTREAKCNAADPLRFPFWPELSLSFGKRRLGFIKHAKIMNRRFTILTLTMLALGQFVPAWAGDDKNGGGGGGGGSDKNGGDDDNSTSGGGFGSGSGSSTANGANFSGTNGYKGKDNEIDTAQKAVSHGEAVSLNKLLNHIKATYEGAVINVELVRLQGRYFYKVKILTSDNTLRVVQLDALKLTEPETASIY